MREIHVFENSSVDPERVLAAAGDFSERRAQLWPDVYVEHLEVHELGETFADVTEGNPWPIGYVWERLRYRLAPGSVKATVTGSNLFATGSTWELRATPAGDGSRVEIARRFRLCGLKGRLLVPFFGLGFGKRYMAAHLHHFLSRLDQDDS